MRQLRASTICVVLLVATSAFAHPFKCTSAIESNFNGTAIAAGDYVWFNGVLKVNGIGSAPATIFATHAGITFTANGHTYQLTVPDSQITFSSSITLATTEFTRLSHEIGSPLGWKTELPSSGLAGNDLFVSADLKGSQSGRFGCEPESWPMVAGDTNASAAVGNQQPDFEFVAGLGRWVSSWALLPRRPLEA
jgi:hypothetical protein